MPKARMACIFHAHAAAACLSCSYVLFAPAELKDMKNKNKLLESQRTSAAQKADSLIKAMDNAQQVRLGMLMLHTSRAAHTRAALAHRSSSSASALLEARQKQRCVQRWRASWLLRHSRSMMRS
jgi:hypothetical protein